MNEREAGAMKGAPDNRCPEVKRGTSVQCVLPEGHKCNHKGAGDE